MNISDRPTNMLHRQLMAMRLAARAHYPKSFAHLMPYRPHFVREILAMRAELRRRNES